jgi:Lysyl oxidase
MRSRRFVLALAAALSLAAGVLGTAYALDKAPDLEGTPDLIVYEEATANQWVVRDERLAASFCSVIEGDVTPGLRRLLRFTVMTPNIGDADINVGNPQDHVDANDGLFEFAECHAHYHFRHYTTYELVDPATGKVWRAAKRGFCMLDTDPNHQNLSAGPPYYRSCGTTTVAGNQGISARWSDTYRFFLGGQYFVLDGGDGQEVVPPGDYVIRITVNPPFTAAAGEACPHTDAAGMCHQLPESSYTNNVANVPLTIPAHVGKSGHGPAKDDPQPKGEPAEH